MACQTHLVNLSDSFGEDVLMQVLAIKECDLQCHLVLVKVLEGQGFGRRVAILLRTSGS